MNSIGGVIEGNTNTENTQKINSETSQKKVLLRQSKERSNQADEIIINNSYYEENKKLLAGIKSAKNGEAIWAKVILDIANAPETNPRFIRVIQSKWKQKNGGMDIPLLITMLRDDPPVMSEKEERHRYTEGEFSWAINH